MEGLFVAVLQRKALSAFKRLTGRAVVVEAHMQLKKEKPEEKKCICVHNEEEEEEAETDAWNWTPLQATDCEDCVAFEKVNTLNTCWDWTPLDREPLLITTYGQLSKVGLVFVWPLSKQRAEAFVKA
ncbi:hypothetical protein Efla_006897 [Eimeria flavescens]